MASETQNKQCKLQDADGHFECRMPLDDVLVLAGKGDAYCVTNVNAATPVFRRRERFAGSVPSPTQLTSADTHALLGLLGERATLSRARMNAVLGNVRAERLIGYGVVADPDKRKTA